MAIEVLNEWSFTKDTILSELVSVHCKPVLYYRATKAGVSYSEVIILSITFRASQIDEDATYFYYQLDLSDTLKHLITVNDNPDILDFQASGGTYENDMVDVGVTFTISTRDSGGSLVETTNEFYDLAHLSHDIPNESGFNLWEQVSLRNLQPLKWSNDTYNALFIYTKAEFVIYNRTTGKSFNWVDVNPKFVQAKFDKRIQEKYDLKRYFNIDDIDAFGSDSSVLFPGGLTEVIDAATLKTDKLVFVDDTSGNNRLLITADLPVNETVTLSTPNDGIKKSYSLKWTNSGTPADNIIVSPMTADNAAPAHKTGENIRAEIELNDAYHDSILIAGKNQLEIIANDGANDYAFAAIEIDYDPYGCYIPLIWEHPKLGYVSYPFEGAEIESIQATKTTEVKKFLTTLIDVNELKDIKGYQAEPTISLTANVETKYWDLFKELYSSRNVYLYIGDIGDEDNKTNWVRVEVAGSYTINNNRQKTANNFTIDLRLPEKLNIKM